MATASFNQYFTGYEILGELGRGNARVLKARDRSSGELVAIKHFTFNTDTETLHRFQRESEIMTSIQHKYVVKIVDVQLDAELPYIVMELIEGGDLRGLIKEKENLSVDETIRLARQMTEALETIHNKKIVHRDIKPENIMYRRLPTGELHFFLTDFGIAKLREQSNTVTGSSMLTYEYASPEQFTQSRLVTVPTDYYSLGIVLYECLRGQVPFEYEAGDLRSHIHRVIGEPVPAFQLPANQFLPASLMQLVRGMLEKSPQKRITDPVKIRQLLDLAAIENLQRTNPGKTAVAPTRYKITEEVPVSTVLQKPTRPRRGLQVFIAVSIMLAVAAAGLFLSASHRRPSLSYFFPDSDEKAEKSDSSNYRNNIGKETMGTEPRAIMPPLVVPDENNSIPVSNGLYFQDFSNENDSVWEKSSDEDRDIGIENGKYVIRGRKAGYSYEFTPRFNIDISKDFTISANATWQQGNPDDGFGINYAADIDSESYYVFYITAGGYYQIASFSNGEWKNLVDWTRSPNIHTGTVLNTIAISKSGDKMNFYINDYKEAELPAHPAFGSGFGLRVDGAQTVAFDQFIVKTGN